MPALLYVAKAATPEQLSWRARIARNEKPLLDAFLAWVQAVRRQVGVGELVEALLGRAQHAFDQVFQAVAWQPTPLLEQTAVEEAVREFDRVVRQVDAGLRLSLDLRDPNFYRAVDEQGARLVREVSDETKRAVSNVIARAYRDGLHPYVVAPQLAQLVGLTSRQAQAVLSFRNALEAKGLPPATVASSSDRYAERMLTRRGRTIARTETARAQVLGRLESYRQAQTHGLLAPGTMLEWASVQTDPNEVCYQLDGKQVPLGETFDGLLPPAHPNCRCSVDAVVASQPDLAERLRARIPEINRRLGIPA